MDRPIKILLSYTIIILVFFMIGCTKVTDYSPTNLTPITPENATNSSSVETAPVDDSLKVNESYTNIFFFKSEGDCAFVVTKSNATYLIDCGSSNYLETIGKIKKLGYEKIDIFIVTNSLKENEENIDKLALKFKPSVIHNTGLPTSYNSYKDFNFSMTLSVSSKLGLDSIDLYPTYLDGFLPSQELNTIVPVIEDKIVIMGSCNGECEKRFTEEDIPIISLANNGNCNTNPTLFLIQIDPSDIIINTDNLCANMTIDGKNISLKKDIEAMDLPVYNRKQYDVQIILGETNEIRTK